MTMILRFNNLFSKSQKRIKTSTRTTRSALLGFQRLESRTVLAGNVLAEVSGGDLILEGDFDDNSLVVDQIGLAADQYRISSGANPTTINGSGVPLVLSGITDGLEVKLADGNDTLVLGNGAFTDKVKIEGGDGANKIELTSFGFGADLEVQGKTGFDYVIVTDSTVSGNAKFKYDDGGDDGFGSFRSSLTVVKNSTFEGNLNIEGKDGTDSAFFDTTSIDGNVNLKFGDGGALSFGPNPGGTVFITNSDLGENLTIENEVGIDQFDLVASTVAGNVTIENGAGADDGLGNVVAAIPSSIVDSQIGGNLEYKSGDGQDTFALANSTVEGNVKLNFGEGGSSSEIALGTLIGGDLTIEAKRGSDTVAFTEVTVLGDTKVKTGDDDDFISLLDSVFAKFEADGGEGIDRFDDLSGDFFSDADSPKLKNVEIIV